MKKALNFKERLFQIAKIYDGKTKGKKTTEECLAKAMEKLKNALNFDETLVTSEGNKTPQQSTDVEDVISEDSVINVSTLFPEMDEFYFIDRHNAFYEYLYHLKTKPFQLLSPEYFINKGRRSNYRVPEVKWHISQNNTIVGYEIQEKFYPLVHRRKYFDTTSNKYIFPPTAKIIDSFDAFFKKTYNMPTTKITHIVENQATRFEEMENLFYKHFEKSAEISNEIHNISLQNTKTFFPYIFRALQETFNAKMPAKDSNKRHFFEMYFYLKGTEWARKIVSKINDGPEEGLFPIIGNDSKVVALFLKLDEWLDILLHGSEEDRMKHFPEMTQLGFWKDCYHYPGMRDAMRMDTDGVFHFPEHFHSKHRPKLSESIKNLQCEKLNKKEIHELLLKLRLATKDNFEKSLRNRVESHEQTSKLLAKFEDYNDRRTRASLILFSLAEATFNYKRQLPDSLANAFDDPLKMLTQEAVLINREHVPPRQQSRRNERAAKTNASKNLIEKAINIRKTFNLIPEKENEAGEKVVGDKDGWMHMEGDVRKDSVLYDKSIALDFTNPDKGSREVALNDADLNERELTEVLYTQYIETNRTASNVNRLKEINQRALCHFRREDYRNQVFDSIVKSQTATVFIPPEVEKPTVTETLETTLSLNRIFSEIVDRQRKRKKKKIKRQLRNELTTVSSARKIVQQPKRKVFASKAWLARAKRYREKRESIRKNARVAIKEAHNRQPTEDGDQSSIKIIKKLWPIPTNAPHKSALKNIKLKKAVKKQVTKIQVPAPIKKKTSKKISNVTKRPKISPLVSQSLTGAEIFAKKTEREKITKLPSAAEAEENKLNKKTKSTSTEINQTSKNNAAAIFDHAAQIFGIRSYNQIKEKTKKYKKEKLKKEKKQKSSMNTSSQKIAKKPSKKIKKKKTKPSPKEIEQQKSKEVQKATASKASMELKKKHVDDEKIVEREVVRRKATNISENATQSKSTLCAVIKTISVESEENKAVETTLQTTNSYLLKMHQEKIAREKLLNHLKREAREHQARLKREAKKRRERRRREEMERERVILIQKAEKEKQRAEKLQERVEQVFKEQEARAKKEAEIAAIRDEINTARRRGSITSIKSLTISQEELQSLSERAQSMTPNIPEIIPLTKENLQIHNEMTSNATAENPNVSQTANHVQVMPEKQQQKPSPPKENDIGADKVETETIKKSVEKELTASSVPDHVKAVIASVTTKKPSSSKTDKKRNRKRNASMVNASTSDICSSGKSNKARSEETFTSNYILINIHTNTRDNFAGQDAAAIVVTKSLDSGSSNSPELGKDFGTFLAETQRRSNESVKKSDDIILEYTEEMPEIPLIVERPSPINMDDIEELPSPIMEEEAQFTHEDLPLIEASSVTNASQEDQEIDANTTMSTTSSKGLRGKKMRGRYDKKVKWSRKKITKTTPTLPPPSQEETDVQQQPLKKPRKPRQKHKWRQTPSRTPSPPPPSPPLPPKRRRAQAVPFQINYESPRKRKRAENQENDNNTDSQPPSLTPVSTRGQSTMRERTASVQPVKSTEKSAPNSTTKATRNLATKLSASQRKTPEKPPTLKAISPIKSTDNNSSTQQQPRRVGRPRKLVETTNDQPSTSSTTKPLGKRIIKKRVSLSPEPIPIKRKNQRK
uniref:Uncharacterized protein n=1 Tax=Panagrolaimus sp. ES5 TaxID=591445 RepID=A0AC34GQP1_9BILA